MSGVEVLNRNEVPNQQGTRNHKTQRNKKLSQALKKYPGMCNPQKILLNFKGIDLIDEVQSDFHMVPHLMLSQNKIQSLHGLYQFQNLKSLSLSYNNVCFFGYWPCVYSISLTFMNIRIIQISSFNNLKHIKGDRIEALTLEGNPISEHPNYRNTVIEMFPSLRNLDARSVRSEERINIGTLKKKISFKKG